MNIIVKPLGFLLCLESKISFINKIGITDLVKYKQLNNSPIIIKVNITLIYISSISPTNKSTLKIYLNIRTHLVIITLKCIISIKMCITMNTVWHVHDIIFIYTYKRVIFLHNINRYKYKL